MQNGNIVFLRIPLVKYNYRIWQMCSSARKHVKHQVSDIETIYIYNQQMVDNVTAKIIALARIIKQHFNKERNSQ
jgi:hypothetical protein